MLSVRGIYENGKVRLLESVPSEKRAKVIVTILDESSEPEINKKETELHAFDDLIGVIDLRENGSEAHDQYILSKERK